MRFKPQRRRSRWPGRRRAVDGRPCQRGVDARRVRRRTHPRRSASAAARASRLGAFDVRAPAMRQPQPLSLLAALLPAALAPVPPAAAMLPAAGVPALVPATGVPVPPDSPLAGEVGTPTVPPSLAPAPPAGTPPSGPPPAGNAVQVPRGSQPAMSTVTPPSSVATASQLTACTGQQLFPLCSVKMPLGNAGPSARFSTSMPSVDPAPATRNSPTGPFGASRS